jgi:hypothetical protein
MTMLTCNTCGNVWDGFKMPQCPKCLATQWAAKPDLVRTHHDPAVLPSGYPGYRSVLTEDVIARKQDFLEYAAASGDWFYHTEHKKYCHFTPDPLGVIPGSGIKRGDVWPDHALDGLLIADADQDAHAYATDQVVFRRGVASGQLLPLGTCDELGCKNLAVPGHTRCALHLVNPLAS